MVVVNPHSYIEIKNVPLSINQAVIYENATKSFNSISLIYKKTDLTTTGDKIPSILPHCGLHKTLRQNQMKTD